MRSDLPEANKTIQWIVLSDECPERKRRGAH